MNIAVITPSRDEAKYLKETMQCMVNQTLKPVVWVVVDDGSRDETQSVVESFTKKHSFIKYLRLPDRGYRKPGSGVVETFYRGFELVEGFNYDVISKFDADLRFGPELLAEIAETFDKNPGLGICGPTLYEFNSLSGKSRKVLVPDGFVGGPHKFYRAECFRDINGLVNRAGWDGIDNIRAEMAGWQTYEIPSLSAFHMKPKGSATGEGLKRECEKYGDVSYFMGGYFWYFILRVMGRSFERKNWKVGWFMLRGYFKPLLTGQQREVRAFRKYLKKKQVRNMAYWINTFFGISVVTEK